MQAIENVYVWHSWPGRAAVIRADCIFNPEVDDCAGPLDKRSMTDRLDAVFAALADPTRRAILSRLALGEASVMELAEPFAISQPAISKHIKVLERAGLISRGRDAQRRPCRIDARALAEADTWLERYRRLWEANYRRLDALLDELKSS